MAALATHGISSGSKVRALATVLRARLPLPFCFFGRWALHDFHTSKWTRVNPSARIKRTRLGRSSIDQPTMDMVSVSRYGGYAQRESLVTAFRVYRSVDQSETARRAGQEVVRAIQFTDFAFDVEDEQELAVDFACLYLNACVLFSVAPTQEMMTQLLGRLASLLQTSFQWECVLCALVVYLRPTAEAAGTTATAFVHMLQAVQPGVVPGSFSRDGISLLLLVVDLALDILLQTNGAAEDRQRLLDVQQEAIGALCSTAAFSREERLALTDAVCWRHAAGGCFSAVAPVVLPSLRVEAQAALEELSVAQCARRFCALCVALASQHPDGTRQDQELHAQTLDSIVRHLDQRVRVHSVDDIVCVLVGLHANSTARARYKKFPCALLDYLREEGLQEGRGQQQDGKQVPFVKDDDTLRALAHVLLQLASSAEDALAETAEHVMTDMFSSVSV